MTVYAIRQRSLTRPYILVYRNASEERKRMMYLCRCIQDEQDRAKFMALVTELNELLARKEHRLESKTKPNGN